MKSKLARGKDFLAENQGLFKCPKCQESMVAKDLALVCPNHHSFELSKKGTLYFLEKSLPSEYTKDMFQKRKNIIQQGLYAPLLELIKSWITPEAPVLDVGCGEGSFLYELGKEIAAPKIGFDLSKPGIYLASEQEVPQDNLFFCTADLTKLPFSNQAFGTILNIFSPSNYEEFRKVLKPEGVLIKVMPNEFYLKELRESLYEGKKASYSNEAVVSKLHHEVSILEEKRLTYTLPTSQFSFTDLVGMTPLSWSASEEKMQQLLENPFSEITVDLTVVKSQL